MKTLIGILFSLIVGIGSVAAQGNLGIAPKAAAVEHIAIKLDEATGKIELFNVQENTLITQQYQLSHLELEIFDSNGEYAGSLELDAFLIPKNEVDSSEKVKVANIRIKHTATGEELTLTNVDFMGK